MYRRIFDALVSAVLLTLTLPVIVVAAVGSAVSLRAWPFFGQWRVGRDGQLFPFIKIRTLPTTVSPYTDKFQLGSDIPTFCQWLRRFHLDELPQLFLVLIGRMSLVGPRPEMPHLHDLMPSRFAAERTTVRPGCTGLWQISESCDRLISEAPQFDRFYLAQRSLRLDIWILYRTALKMLNLGRTVSVDDVPWWTMESSAEVLELHPEGSSESQVLLPTAAAGR